MTEIKAGFAICGSFCTFSKVIPQMKNLKEKIKEIANKIKEKTNGN